MGFPERRVDAYRSLCACHQEFKREGYFCPRCRTKVCELPATCSVCALNLVSSAHLARSYHHLFPVQPYEDAAKEVPPARSAAVPAGTDGAAPVARDAGSREPVKKGEKEGGSGPKRVRLVLGGKGGRGDDAPAARCFACLQELGGSATRLACPECRHIFCLDCDAFVHESLHNCPGCMS
jgi:transcription initiation factor TFIIH subunit 2